MTEWEPATEVETAMRDALRVDDQESYFRILAGTDLLLPIAEDAAAGRAPVGWGTWTTGGRTHVLAFTSVSTMSACLGASAGAARRMSYRELAEHWPNHDWWLAVNPGLPIEGYLPAWFVAQLARGDARLPTGARARSVGALTPARATAAVPGRTMTPEDGPDTMKPAEGGASAPGPAATIAPERDALNGELSAPPSYPATPPHPVAAGGAAPSGNGSAATPPPAPVDGAAAAPPATDTAADTAPSATDTAGVTGPPPDFTPANEVEESLLAAAVAGNTNPFLSTLLLARVLLPVAPTAAPGSLPGDDGFAWRTERLDDEPYVVVFTSPERLVEHFGAEVATVELKFVQLINAWPDQGWSFAVNPGSPIGAKLPGGQILALASWAAEVGLDAEPEQAGSTEEAHPGPAEPPVEQRRVEPTVMQKTIAPDQLDYYLERGYDRVAGFVHRAAEVAHLTTPAKLYAALGLNYAGSPFTRDVEEAYVLRWPAHRPSLYRIPYGGPDEQAMRAMEGWVIERPPFRGNGFAPGDSGEVIAEFKVDSVRLPHGAELWRIRADGTEELMATLDSDGPVWRRIGER